MSKLCDASLVEICLLTYLLTYYAYADRGFIKSIAVPRYLFYIDLAIYRIRRIQNKKDAIG